jgi:hypothetical protein
MIDAVEAACSHLISRASAHARVVVPLFAFSELLESLGDPGRSCPLPNDQ